MIVLPFLRSGFLIAFASAVRAARQAAASAALDLASSYVNQACDLWSYGTAQAWETDPDLTMDLVTVTAEVALGRRTAASRVDNVDCFPVPLQIPCANRISNIDYSGSGQCFEALHETRHLALDIQAPVKRVSPGSCDEVIL